MHRDAFAHFMRDTSPDATAEQLPTGHDGAGHPQPVRHRSAQSTTVGAALQGSLPVSQARPHLTMHDTQPSYAVPQRLPAAAPHGRGASGGHEAAAAAAGELLHRDWRTYEQQAVEGLPQPATQQPLRPPLASPVPAWGPGAAIGGPPAQPYPAASTWAPYMAGPSSAGTAPANIGAYGAVAPLEVHAGLRSIAAPQQGRANSMAAFGQAATPALSHAHQSSMAPLPPPPQAGLVQRPLQMRQPDMAMLMQPAPNAHQPGVEQSWAGLYQPNMGPPPPAAPRPVGRPAPPQHSGASTNGAVETPTASSPSGVSQVVAPPVTSLAWLPAGEPLVMGAEQLQAGRRGAAALDPDGGVPGAPQFPAGAGQGYLSDGNNPFPAPPGFSQAALQAREQRGRHHQYDFLDSSGDELTADGLAHAGGLGSGGGRVPRQHSAGSAQPARGFAGGNIGFPGFGAWAAAQSSETPRLPKQGFPLPDSGGQLNLPRSADRQPGQRQPPRGGDVGSASAAGAAMAPQPLAAGSAGVSEALAALMLRGLSGAAALPPAAAPGASLAGAPRASSAAAPQQLRSTQGAWAGGPEQGGADDMHFHIPEHLWLPPGHQPSGPRHSDDSAAARSSSIAPQPGGAGLDGGAAEGAVAVNYPPAGPAGGMRAVAERLLAHAPPRDEEYGGGQGLEGLLAPANFGNHGLGIAAPSEQPPAMPQGQQAGNARRQAFDGGGSGRNWKQPQAPPSIAARMLAKIDWDEAKAKGESAAAAAAADRSEAAARTEAAARRTKEARAARAAAAAAAEAAAAEAVGAAAEAVGAGYQGRTAVGSRGALPAPSRGPTASAAIGNAHEAHLHGRRVEDRNMPGNGGRNARRRQQAQSPVNFAVRTAAVATGAAMAGSTGAAAAAAGAGSTRSGGVGCRSSQQAGVDEGGRERGRHSQGRSQAAAEADEVHPPAPEGWGREQRSRAPFPPDSEDDQQ